MLQMGVSNDNMRQETSKWGLKRLQKTAPKKMVDKVELREINHIILGFMRAKEEEAGQGINHMRENSPLGGEQGWFPTGSAISRLLALCQVWCYIHDIQYLIEFSQEPHKANLMILLCRLRNKCSKSLNSSSLFICRARIQA